MCRNILDIFNYFYSISKYAVKCLRANIETINELAMRLHLL